MGEQEFDCTLDEFPIFYESLDKEYDEAEAFYDMVDTADDEPFMINDPDYVADPYQDEFPKG